MKKTLVMVLALALVFGVALTACTSKPAATPSPTAAATEAASVAPSTEATPSAPATKDTLTENRPVLKFLVGGRTYDPNEDIPCKKMMELTGYQVKYEMLPTSNGDEKLMLEMSSGTEYDLVELSGTMFGRLADIGVLTALDKYLADYGDYIVPAVSDLAWKASKNAAGETVGLPRQSGDGIGITFGTRFDNVIMTKQEILDELKLTVPTDLDSFTAFLKAIKAAKNVPPLTGLNVWQKDLMTAFGLPNITWIETANGYVNIAEQPGFKDYIRYMAGLYKDGLLDPDLPINKSENIDQKFTGTGAYVSQYAIWELPRLVPALQANNLSKDLVMFSTPLKDKSGKYVLQNISGVAKYYGVPKSSKAPEHAINYMNLLSEPKIFMATHIGDEGTHYEVKNGYYYPIFPAFNDLNWANQFIGVQERAVEFKQWQARVRKTAEMAVAYEFVNSNLPDATLVLDRSSFAKGLPEVQQNSQALATKLNDFMLKAIVENKTTDEDFTAFLSDYMSSGGQAMKDAMSKWSKDNPTEYLEELFK